MKKIFLMIMIVLSLVTTTFGVLAATKFLAKDIVYTKSGSDVSTVEEALNDIYDKVNKNFDNTKTEVDKYIYVDSINGSDETGDGLISNPFATLDKAVTSNIIEKNYNYVIYLKKGSYTLTTSVFNTKNTKNIMIVGDKLNTELIVNGIYNGNSSNQGSFIGTINFYRLIWRVTNATNNHFQTKGDIRFFNVLFDFRDADQSYSYFDPQYAYYSFENCSSVGVKKVLLRMTEGYIDLFNCYGNFTSGYGTTASKWNTRTNYITTNINVDSDYRILDDESKWKNVGTGKNPDGSTANIGIYGGKYSWDYNIEF